MKSGARHLDHRRIELDEEERALRTRIGGHGPSPHADDCDRSGRSQCHEITEWPEPVVERCRLAGELGGCGDLTPVNGSPRDQRADRDLSDRSRIAFVNHQQRPKERAALPTDRRLRWRVRHYEEDQGECGDDNTGVCDRGEVDREHPADKHNIELPRDGETGEDRRGEHDSTHADQRRPVVPPLAVKDEQRDESSGADKRDFVRQRQEQRCDNRGQYCTERTSDTDHSPGDGRRLAIRLNEPSDPGQQRH